MISKSCVMMITTEPIEHTPSGQLDDDCDTTGRDPLRVTDALDVIHLSRVHGSLLFLKLALI